MGFINGKPETPNQQGWKQFLASRKKILSEYDRAKDLSENHIVKVEHGNVGEAYIRTWLSEFLPKRFAVTAGYVISPGLTENDKTPHFDVIIYDQIESPVLWRSNNPDNSNQGESLAIPAEFVYAVFEIKSRYNNFNMKKAIQHLLELYPLASRFNPDEDGENVFLPHNFFWGIIFFEYVESDMGNLQTLENLWQSTQLRGFMQCLILRHRLNSDQSGNIVLSSTNDGSIIEPKADVYSSTNHNLLFSTTFSSSSFTSFAMRVLSRLNPRGKYTHYAFGGPDHQWVK